jgi:hypothetical protein
MLRPLRSATCLLSVLLHAIVCAAATPNYFMRVWQTDDGLPQSGGRCDIRSAPGEGTAVRLVVPKPPDPVS